MTPDPQQSISQQIQRVAADISARLAQVAKEPPELAAYFRLHAETIAQALQPVGMAYEMATGQSFQRTFSFNYETLGLKSSPAQELAFQRVVRATSEQNKPFFLEPTSAPAEGLHGLSAEDAPAPENLPPHNQTPFHQIFVPIPLSKKVVGVIHAWFQPSDAALANARIAILAHAAAEVELYLKTRRISDISQELSRISTYAHFLEDVAGDQELDSVCWKIVNYAREAVGCERVCLLSDRRYGLIRDRNLPESETLELQACSGLRRPHPRSEHAEVLKGHASELLRIAVVPPGAAKAPSAPAEGDKSAAPAPDNGTPEAAGPSAEDGSKPGRPASTVDQRPPMRIIFTTRDPSKVDSRPEAVNRYFEVISMNWSTVLPLYDRENRVCGTLLFEGQQSSEKVAALFYQMRDLAVSGGRALSTALVWERRRTLRSARVLMRWRDQLMSTPKRSLFLKYGVPGLIALGLLITPFPYNIRGDAMLRPVRVQSVAALSGGRLTEINAHAGDRVKKGQIICVLDSLDLKLQLQQVEQERERSETEASLALRQDRSEVRMQIAKLSAQRAETLAAKLRHDIEQAVIRAPFDGVLVGPQDLSQRRGQVIRVGETVAEIVDPTQWEVKASVREQDVPTLVGELNTLRAKDPNAGIPGSLVLTASPNKSYELKLQDPGSFTHGLDTSGGKYNFSAMIPLCKLDRTPNEIDPGLELKLGYTGRVKFECRKRLLAEILFGDFIRYLRVAFF